MGLAKTLIGFGIGFLVSGFIYHVYDDVINRYISVYIYNPSDVYLVGENLLWDMIPYLILFIGIVCLITGALVGRATRKVIRE